MPRAIVPTEMPRLPAESVAWARSTRRAGGVFHAHVIGVTACRRLRLDRFKSVEPKNLGDMQYFGVCPRCFNLGQRAPKQGD